MGCGCNKGKASRTAAGPPPGGQRLVASADPGRVGPWRLTYPDGSSEIFDHLLPATRMQRRKGGRIDLAA